MTSLFLDQLDLAILTGRKTKSKQIEALRNMGVPFWVNACNAPVVARAAIEGRSTKLEVVERWQPRVVKDKP